MATEIRVSNYNQWKLAPLTKVMIAIGGTNGVDSTYVYNFETIKVGSNYSLTPIQVPNDTGGFTTVAYKIEVSFTAVQLIVNYNEIIQRIRTLGISDCRFYFGKSSDMSFRFTATPQKSQMDSNSVDVLDYSLESFDVVSDDENLETNFKISGIASVDLIADNFEYFI